MPDFSFSLPKSPYTDSRMLCFCFHLGPVSGLFANVESDSHDLFSSPSPRSLASLDSSTCSGLTALLRSTKTFPYPSLRSIVHVLYDINCHLRRMRRRPPIDKEVLMPVGLAPYHQNTLSCPPSPQTMGSSMVLGTCSEKTARIWILDDVCDLYLRSSDNTTGLASMVNTCRE